MTIIYETPTQKYALSTLINYNSSGYSTGITLGTIPKGSYITGVNLDVITAFDAAAWGTLGFVAGNYEYAYNILLDSISPRHQLYYQYLDNITAWPLAADRNVVFKGNNSPTVRSAILTLEYVY